MGTIEEDLTIAAWIILGNLVLGVVVHVFWDEISATLARRRRYRDEEGH